MKDTKKTVLNLLAKAGMRTAINAAGAASSMGYCQPQEPKQLKSLAKSKK